MFDNVDTFVHELNMFASSPFSMEKYDRLVQYPGFKPVPSLAPCQPQVTPCSGSVALPTLNLPEILLQNKANLREASQLQDYQQVNHLPTHNDTIVISDSSDSELVTLGKKRYHSSLPVARVQKLARKSSHNCGVHEKLQEDTTETTKHKNKSRDTIPDTPHERLSKLEMIRSM